MLVTQTEWNCKFDLENSAGLLGGCAEKVQCGCLSVLICFIHCTCLFFTRLNFVFFCCFCFCNYEMGPSRYQNFFWTGSSFITHTHTHTHFLSPYTQMKGN